MKMSFFSNTIIFLGLVTLFACGDDAAVTDTTDSLNTAATAVNEMLEKISSAQVLAPTATMATASLRPSNIGFFAASDWTEEHLDSEGDADTCEDMTTPQGHIQSLQSSDCTVAPLFDLSNLLTVVCVVVGSLDTDASGNPDVFDDTVTLSEDTVSGCGLEAELAGESMPVVVEEVEDNDDYTRKLTVTTGSTVRTIYWGRSDDAFSLSFYYLDGNGGSSAYKGFYAYDTASSTMAFELQALAIEGDPAISFFRLHLDESETVAVANAVGSYRDEGSSDNIRWALQSDTDGSSEVAVNMSWSGQTSGTGVETCVDLSDFSASGSASACDTYTAPSVDTFGTLMNSTFSAFQSLDSDDFEDAFSAEDAVDFDADTIVSASAVN